MDHEQTMGVNSKVLDQKRQNISGRISLFWSVELQSHTEQLNGGDNDRLIPTPVSTVHTLCIQFSAERAANVVDLERQW